MFPNLPYISSLYVLDFAIFSKSLLYLHNSTIRSPLRISLSLILIVSSAPIKPIFSIPLTVPSLINFFASLQIHLCSNVSFSRPQILHNVILNPLYSELPKLPHFSFAHCSLVFPSHFLLSHYCSLPTCFFSSLYCSE